MAVNLSVPVASELKPVSGLELGYAKASIKKENRKDLLVMRLAPSATVSGVFTRNRFCAAPVRICKTNLEKTHAAGKNIRALMVNTGNANAGNSHRFSINNHCAGSGFRNRVRRHDRFGCI